jgi:hypothetical protein
MTGRLCMDGWLVRNRSWRMGGEGNGRARDGRMSKREAKNL